MTNKDNSPSVIILDTVNSTNDYLKKIVHESSIEEFSIVLTKHQTDGRGQMGNSWESEKNKNLTLSTIWKPEFIPVNMQFYISKAVSLAVLDTLSKFDSNFSIKWPNDIYHFDKKIGGILIENSIMGHNIQYTIIGIGLNINQTLFKSNAPNPISLKKITNKIQDLELILELLTDNLLQRYDELSFNELDHITNDYLAHLYRINQFHHFKIKDDIQYAKIVTVTESGYLVLETDKGFQSQYAFKAVEFII